MTDTHEARVEFGDALSEVHESLRAWNLNYEDRKVLGEMIRFGFPMKNDDALHRRDRQHLGTWIDRGQDVVHSYFSIEESLGLRNFGEDIVSNPYRARTRAMSLIISLDAIEVGEPKFDRSGSLWRETRISLKGLLNGIDQVLSGNFDDSHTGLTLFILLNSLEAMKSITNPSISEKTERAPSAPELKTQFENLTKNYSSLLVSNIDHSPGMNVYAFDLQSRGILPESINVEKPNPPNDNRTGIFWTLMRLRCGETVPNILPENIPNEKSHLWGLARAWLRAKSGEPTGIIPDYSRVDIDSVFLETWQVGAETLQSVSIQQHHLEKVRGMNDDEIRSSLKDIFEKNEAISVTSASSLHRERDKAHGPWEISDFDIEIDRGSEESIFVSFPIKSQPETGGQSVERVSERNVSQFYRPLTRFKDCAVFPIIIAQPSSAANESTKQLRSQLGFPVQIIDEEMFTRILKFHEVI